MRTAAQETAFQTALRNCSKEAGEGISGPRAYVWLLQRRTASGCICTAENNWILFTLSQRKVPGQAVPGRAEGVPEALKQKVQQRMDKAPDNVSTQTETRPGKCNIPGDPGEELGEGSGGRRLWSSAPKNREEADALHEYPNELKTDLAVGDQDTLQEDQLDRKRFLEEFPRVKQELEEGIKKLHALADKADKVHKGCTISNVAAASAGTVSGVLTILGLTLAPVTAGASLALLATGVGLGAAAAVTSVSATIVESVGTSAAETEASRLTATADNNEEGFAGIVCNNTVKLASSIEKFCQATQEIKNNVRAIKLAKVNPNLAARAKRFTATGQVSVKGGRQVQTAFRGTALAMTKGARIAGVATAGVSLLVDVAFLVKDAKHLLEGAKTESAERLRQQARELEKKLEVLTRVYERLQ